MWQKWAFLPCLLNEYWWGCAELLLIEQLHKTIYVALSLWEIVMLNFFLFFLWNAFTQLLILSIHPLPEAYRGLCCFFPQAASQSPSLGSWSIPQLDGMRNIIHPICSGLAGAPYMPGNSGHPLSHIAAYLAHLPCTCMHEWMSKQRRDRCVDPLID